MKKIGISDVSMKRAGQSFSLSFREKIELTKLLDKLGVSVIELEGIKDPRPDTLLIKSVASAVRDSIVAVMVPLGREGATAVWNALSQAGHPRLQVTAALSSVQMEYIHHKKPEAMLRSIKETMKACREFCSEMEFIAEDTTRSDSVFLSQAIRTAIDAGAVVITLCESAGTMLPGEFAGFLESICKDVPELTDVSLAISCSDNLSMADACSIAALYGNIQEVKAAAYPAGSASLSNISRIISTRGDSLGVSCSVKAAQLSRIIDQISRMCQNGRSKTSPFDNGVRQEENGVYLTSHDDMEEVLRFAAHLGYELSEEDGQRVFEAFQNISDKKDRVSSREMDAIVASAAMQVPSTL